MRHLPMHPQGWAGRAFGVLMERLNRPAYAAAAHLLAPREDEHFLEIGFGTGGLVARLLSANPTVRVAGVDPTSTMVRVASTRREVASASHRADLREGRDAPLPWPDAHFHGAAALHSFQFWPDPAASVAEIARVLVPGGRLVLILRDHGKRPPAWLPNDVSRSGDEVRAARNLLAASGFRVRLEAPVGSSAVLFAIAGEPPPLDGDRSTVPPGAIQEHSR